MTFVESAYQSRLIEKVKEKFPLLTYTPVRRNTYNKACGMEFIQELCFPSLNSVLLVLQNRYYALAAASALIKFLQNNLSIFYASGSIRIEYQESEGYALIDISTADRLELVSSTRPLQASKYSTLFGVLNNCYTKIGERALRTLILQPPFNTDIIMERQSCVTELIQRPEKLQAIQIMLQKLGTVDRLLTLSSIVTDDSETHSTRQLNHMLYLNGLVDIVASFQEVVSDLRQKTFVKLSNILQSPDFDSIKNTVRSLIHENAYAAKSQPGLLQRCFAIKPGINTLLDLVRKIYSERVEDMREYVKTLGEKYDLPLTMKNNITKGYHIVYSLNKHQKISVKKSDIPKEFIQVQRLTSSFTMKTMELLNFQSRIDSIVADILKISQVMIFKILTSFKKYMGLFFELCDSVAEIDVIQSLAEVSIRNDYVKPEFACFTEIHDSQHPMLDMLAQEKPVPNLIQSCEDFNIHIITGPNGSGKSLFIRQVMLLQIMAQMGGYVPATSAIVRPADRMFARVYFEDDMECGASSFVLEMKEIIYIMNQKTDNSLIIIDELARSTSLEEGAALAMAICESFVDTAAFVYLTSHFTLVTKLEDLYVNIKNWHLDTNATGDTPQTLELDYKYTVQRGVTNLRRYGIFVVKNIWPKEILEDVYSILQKDLERKEESSRKIPPSYRLKYQLESDLRKLELSGNWDNSKVNQLMNEYSENLRKIECNLILDDLEYPHQLQPENNSRRILCPKENEIDNFAANESVVPEELNSSDEMLAEATDQILSQMSSMQQIPHQVNEDKNMENCSYNSNYEKLSDFLKENSKHINLLEPELDIFSFDASREINFEEIDHRKTNKINILENITLIPPQSQDEENVNFSLDYRTEMENLRLSDNNRNYDYSPPLSQNLSQIRALDNANFTYSHFSTSQRSNATQDSFRYSPNEEMIIEGDIAINSQGMNEHFKSSRNNPNYLPIWDNSFENETESINNVPSQISNYSFRHQETRAEDFHFMEPSGEPPRKRSFCQNKSTENLDTTNQYTFSLPLLQNREKTSTPIRTTSTPIRTTSTPIRTTSTQIRTTSTPIRPTSTPIKTSSTPIRTTSTERTSKSQNINIQKHIFPKVNIVEGSNNLTPEFGTEEKIFRGPPFPTEKKSMTPKEIVTVCNEEISTEEIQSIFDNSEDLFDVDSLEICDDGNNEENPKITAVANEQLNRDLLDEIKFCSVEQNDEIHSDISKDDCSMKRYPNVPDSKVETFFLRETLSETPPKTVCSHRVDENIKEDTEKITISVNEGYRINLNDKTSNSSLKEPCCNIPDENDTSKEQMLDGSRRIIQVSTEINNSNNNPNDTFKEESETTNPIRGNGGVQISNSIEVIENLINNTKEESSTEKTNREINISTGISSEVTPRTNLFNRKEKTDTISVSEASRRRNLDNSSPTTEERDTLASDDHGVLNSSPALERTTRRDNNTSTSISEASRRRNLEGSSSNTSQKEIKSSTNVSDTSKQRNSTTNSDSSVRENMIQSNGKCETDFPELKPIFLREEEDFGFLKSTEARNYDDNKIGEYLNVEDFPKKRKLDIDSSIEKDEQENNEIKQRKTEKKLKKQITVEDIKSFDSSSKYETANEGSPTNNNKSIQTSQNGSNMKFPSSSNEEGESSYATDSLDAFDNTNKTKNKKVLGYTRRGTSSSDSRDITKSRKSLPVYKMKKYQIQQEFEKQDRMFLEDDDMDPETYNKYLEQRMNRPTVKQLQQAEHIATFRKTEKGTMIIPAPAKKNTYKPRKYTKRVFETSKPFNVSIFSDANATKLSAFLESDERDYTVFSSNYDKQKHKMKRNSSFSCSLIQKQQNVTFKRSRSFGEFEFQNFTNIGQNYSQSFMIGHQSTQVSQGSSIFIPEGYLKHNKEDIESICAKYSFQFSN